MPSRRRSCYGGRDGRESSKGRAARMDARDLMTRDVVTLTPEMSVPEAADALLHYRIHGAPVVDRTEQLVGMVSFADLAGRSDGTVLDVMKPDPISAAEDTPVEELAATMLDQMVRRIPIVRGGRVVGIVSVSDIIKVFLNLHEGTSPLAQGRSPRDRAVPSRTARRGPHPRIGGARGTGRRPSRAGASAS